MSLPKLMVMRSSLSGKYLSYGKGKAATLSSSLTFSHEVNRPSLDTATKSVESLKEKITPSEKMRLKFHLLKFEVEEAKNVPRFFHIRTCYNNKYLVRKSKESKRVVAEAHEAEEDQSKWLCTLFKPVFLGEAKEEEGRGCVYGSNKHGIGMVPQKIQLLHLVKGEEEYYVSESMELIKKKDHLNQITTLTVSDMTPSAQLPKYVTFKCHDGSKYLGSADWYVLGFQFSDMADQGVAMVNRDSGSGQTDVSIYCGSQYCGGDWTPNMYDYINLSDNSGARFTPVKVNNYVAFYCPDRKKFLQRDTTKKNGCLSTLSPNINDEAKFQVGEPVLSRTILNITYDLDNARVYDTTNVAKITDSRSNYTDHEDTGSLSKEYSMSQTMTWSQSITLGMSMSMKMSLGVPKLGFGEEISINYDISGTSTWGKETSHTDTVTHVYNFDVPPMKKQTKSVVTSRSSCDIPFTCDVEDLLVNGTIRTYTIPDCLFTGANDYDANKKTYEERLTLS